MRTTVCIFIAYGLLLSADVMAQTRTIPVVGQLVDPVRLRGIEDVYIVDEYMYLPCREGERLTVCSIEDPVNPRIVSSFTHPYLSHASGFAINNNTVYLASQGNQRLLVVDASDKTDLRLLGSVKVGTSDSGILYKVAYRDGYCFVAHQSDKRLFVVDVREPSQPAVVASVVVTAENDGPFSVLLHGDYAYVGTIFGSHNRLAVVDIKNPAEPHLVTEIFDPAVGQVSGEVVDDLFFAVNWDTNAFLIFDLSNPSTPKLMAKLVDERLGKPNRCVVMGARAYLPMVGGDGVAVVNIADPKNPTFLTSFQDPIMDKTYGVAIHKGLLYVGAREGNSIVVIEPDSLETVLSESRGE